MATGHFARFKALLASLPVSLRVLLPGISAFLLWAGLSNIFSDWERNVCVAGEDNKTECFYLSNRGVPFFYENTWAFILLFALLLAHVWREVGKEKATSFFVVSLVSYFLEAAVSIPINILGRKSVADEETTKRIEELCAKERSNNKSVQVGTCYYLFKASHPFHFE